MVIGRSSWICVGAACANALLSLAAGFAHSSASVALVASYAALAALVGGAEAALAPLNDRTSKNFSPAALAAQASGLLLMAVWFGAPLFAGESPSLWVAMVGGAAISAGVALRATAIASLGARFNSDNYIERDATLETSGLYRRFAHPSELGLLLIALGASVFWGAATLWLVALLYLVTIARLSLEEAALTKAHGARYARYRRRTLDPFPYLVLQGGSRP